MRNDIHFLKSLVYEGARQKQLALSDDILDRINHELSNLMDEKVCEFLLHYKRIIDVCNRLNIVRSPGRGATASSLVCYTLDLTTINPLEYGLHFEKLNPKEGLQYLDIQTDLPAMSRELVLNEIQKEFHDSQLARVVIPLKKDEELMDQHLIHQSVAFKPHACAVVIIQKGDRRLIERDGHYFMPILDYSSEITNIWHYRFNLLALTYLDPIQQFVNERGMEYHPKNYPIDDRVTYELFASGETKGVYMFEADSMKMNLRKLRPKHLKDLTLLCATFRPHALRLLPTMIKSKYSWEVDYPKLSVVERIAEESYGIPFYQETYVELMEQLAGIPRKKAWYYFLSLASGEEEAREEFPNLFVNGCMQIELISENAAKDLAAFMVRHAPSTFQKAHSVCYGLMAYWMGYFNVHFKSAFVK